MLNYLPLRNVLTWGIKATVKNKALPDPANTPSLVSLSLSPTPFTLRLPLDPAEAEFQQMLGKIEGRRRRR